MNKKYTSRRGTQHRKGITREQILTWFMFCIAFIICWRLFNLQVIEHNTYSALASGQYELFKNLFPERGEILMKDSISDEYYPVVTNQRLYEVYAQPKYIENPEEVAQQLFELLNITDEEEMDLIKVKLAKEDDPYEPIAKKVPQDIIDMIDERDITGIGYTDKLSRYYPEKYTASHITGFVRQSEETGYIGQYGLEGYFNEELKGEQGYLRSERDAFGRWISVGERSYKEAQHGANIYLTIDKSIQYKACEALKDGVEEYEAESGSVVVMDPHTGAIIAMCNYPYFDPNIYNEVEDINVYNNTAIFGAYEPGSIFKPITAASAIDTDKVSPNTLYTDYGAISYNNNGSVETDPSQIRFTLRNYDQKTYGLVTLTEVLEKSLNTGTIYMMQQAGEETFRKYVRDFGFGELTGIELDTEVAGDIRSLEKPGEIFSATASFGQGITVTPLQMVTAYSVFANGGKLIRPHIVDKIVYGNGEVQTIETEVIRQVLSARAASLVTGMLVSVIDNGHGSRAAVPGYYLAGKTGTAQVAERGVYGEDTIHSFIGFGPTDDARFVMLVRIDKPKIPDATSSQTTAVIFSKIAQFIIDYYKIPPQR